MMETNTVKTSYFICLSLHNMVWLAQHWL